MDSRVKIYIDKAENELRLARAIFHLSQDENIKKELLVNPGDTFYSSVISHSYYAIFYCARAYLFSKKIKAPEQGQHQFVYQQFKKFVEQGILEKELLEIYDSAREKAEVLLDIFKFERNKRADFTYKTLARANIPPAQESLDNAIKFIVSIKLLLRRR